MEHQTAYTVRTDDRRFTVCSTALAAEASACGATVTARVEPAQTAAEEGRR